MDTLNELERARKTADKLRTQLSRIHADYDHSTHPSIGLLLHSLSKHAELIQLQIIEAGRVIEDYASTAVEDKETPTHA